MRRWIVLLKSLFHWPVEKESFNKIISIQELYSQNTVNILYLNQFYFTIQFYTF